MTAEGQIKQQLNAGAAALNRELFAKNGVFVLSISGRRGCGKTSLLDATLHRCHRRPLIGVIVANVDADRDVTRLRDASSQVVGIEAGQMTAELLREALRHIDLSALDALLIERPHRPDHLCEDLGQSASVRLLSISDPDDDAMRHPECLEHPDLLLLTKSDTTPVAGFDESFIRTAVAERNPQTQVVKVSVVTGEGLGEWCDWLRTNAKPRNA